MVSPITVAPSQHGGPVSAVGRGWWQVQEARRGARYGGRLGCSIVVARRGDVAGKGREIVVNLFFI